MTIKYVKNDAKILVGEYPFHDTLKEELLPFLENCGEGIGPTNVTGFHTEWSFMPDNIKVIRLKEYICNETYNNLATRSLVNQKTRFALNCYNFWGNIYYKGDCARCHNHLPTAAFSFAYFLKAKWYYSPLVFKDSGKRIRPKEGRFVIFPGYLDHSVPKHRFKETRITLSGNISSHEVE